MRLLISSTFFCGTIFAIYHHNNDENISHSAKNESIRCVFFCIVRLISTGFFLYKHSDFVFIVLLLRLRGLPDAVLLPRIKSPSNFDFFGGKLVFFCSPVAVKLPSAPLSLAAGR